ncbi:MAG: NUDIX hydrolase [bacterium]
MDTGIERILGEGDFIRLLSRDGWEYVVRKGVSGIVVIVPVTDDGRIILVEQYRHAVQKAVIELPAGLVGDKPGHVHEDFSTAAHRELLEETGYEAQLMISLVAGPVNPAMSRDYYTFFHAKGLKRVHDGGGDATEKIKVHEIPLGDVHQWLYKKSTDGFLVDTKVFVGLYFATKVL